MPRPKSGPRLWLDPERETWSIIDGRRTTRTGCGKSDVQKAKEFLADYLAANHSIAAGSDPLIADVLTVYCDEHLAGLPSERSVLGDMDRLADWWGIKPASAINPENCKLYIAHRDGPTICRRELGMLHAAVMYWHKGRRGPLRTLPIVFKPPMPTKRTRWLTRTEAAQFLWHGVRKLNPRQRRRMFRFFVIGWYTGTRHSAIGGTSWAMVDLEARIMHRRPPGVAETKKRTPPLRIGRRLLSHLRRWRRLDGPEARYIIAHGGEAARDMGDGWRNARRLSGLSADVTPHTLRHSRATHLMRQGKDIWQSARSLGMSVEMLETTYGHHRPDWQSDVAEAK